MGNAFGIRICDDDPDESAQGPLRADTRGRPQIAASTQARSGPIGAEIAQCEGVSVLKLVFVPLFTYIFIILIYIVGRHFWDKRKWQG